MADGGEIFRLKRLLDRDLNRFSYYIYYSSVRIVQILLKRLKRFI